MSVYMPTGRRHDKCGFYSNVYCCSKRGWDDALPRNVKWLRGVVRDGTVVGGRAHSESFRVIIPPAARVKQTHIDVGGLFPMLLTAFNVAFVGAIF